jgi:tetratricopeptide (TPR) repeat protein
MMTANPSPTPPILRRGVPPVLQGALIVLLVLAAYYPALHGGFIMDDDDNIVTRTALRSLDGLKRIWIDPNATMQYFPLTHTTYWLDYHFWGLNPFGYHLENVLLHALSALLLWRLLTRLQVKAAWLGAALFALHPVCVESVAWMTERKNTLSAVFFLASLTASIKFWLPECAASGPNGPEPAGVKSAGPPQWKFFWLALALYLCALLSKTTTVALPVVVFGLIWWKRGRVEWRNIVLLLPFLAVGLAMGLAIAWLEKHKLGAIGNDWNLSLLDRLLLAGRIVWFYAGKLVWPHPLMFMYPRWVIHAAQPVAYLPLLAAAVGFAILWRKRNGLARPFLFVTVYFVAMLFPVLGFFNIYFSRYSHVNDHFQYLAALGFLPLAAVGIMTVAELMAKHGALWKPAVCTAVLLVLGLLSWRQAHIYRDAETLWRDTIAHNPEAWMAHNNLGAELNRQGKRDEAIQQFDAALRIRPTHAPAYYNTGLALAAKGDFAGAIPKYTKAIELEPGFAYSYYSLGIALANLGRFDEAISQFQITLQMQPNYAPGYFNLGNTLAAKGQSDEALACFRRTLQIEPKFADALVAMANTWTVKGRLDEATNCLRQALQINPQHAGALAIMGNLLLAGGRFDEAIDYYHKTLQINPNHAGVLMNLGNALLSKGQLDEGIEAYRKSLQFDPGNVGTHFNLGIALERRSKFAEAREQFAEALRLKPDFAAAQKHMQAIDQMPGNAEPIK